MKGLSENFPPAANTGIDHEIKREMTQKGKEDDKAGRAEKTRVAEAKQAVSIEPIMAAERGAGLPPPLCSGNQLAIII